ncbi:MAG: 30S ribosomal protein S13 [Propionibacteriaceae bacterium]|nr:30S ribosomal protein S13 [Propionibacteriaceae bacterium]
MAIPKRDESQLASAREAATAARRKRAELKAMLSRGDISLGEALSRAAGDRVLANMKVSELLRALPRIGDRRASALMESLTIAPNRRIRGLGRLQVAGLKAEFGER